MNDDFISLCHNFYCLDAIISRVALCHYHRVRFGIHSYVQLCMYRIKVESIKSFKHVIYNKLHVSHFAFLIAHVQMITRPNKVPTVHMITTPDTAKITSSETAEFSKENAKPAHTYYKMYNDWVLPY